MPICILLNMANMHNDPRRAAEERAFIEKVAKYMQHAQQPFDAHPVLAGRPVNLFVLFQLISRAGSSKRVTQQNGWPALARNLGVPPEQYPNAGPELQQIFQRNLGPLAEAGIAMDRKNVDIAHPGKPGHVRDHAAEAGLFALR